MGVYRGYNDTWIRENVSRYSSWRNLFNAYYEIFHFGNYRNFRNHLYTDLGMTRKFTEEQNEWIKQNYPKLGAEEATKRFNKIFNVGRGRSTIVNQAYKLGIKVNTDIVRQIEKRTNQKRPVGYEAIRKNTKGHEVVWIKCEDGSWVQKARSLVRPLDKHERVIHLDGDAHNNSQDNLEVIDLRTLCKMTSYKMWSSNAVITKTAVRCIQLENILEDSEGS